MMRRMSIENTPEENRVKELLKQSNDELERSKKILQDLANEVTAMTDIVQPALEKQIGALRSARMSTVNEIRESLSSLREIRKFFIEDDYEVEMNRLERFVKLCRELQELKAAGVFDAVCDAALRLAVK